MPIYEYECRRCHYEFEVLVRASEVPTCPECGTEHLEKRLSVTAAPVAAEGQLPAAPGGLCGRPQCAQGGCQGF
jgi:putative FmdB family regulatory protein